MKIVKIKNTFNRYQKYIPQVGAKIIKYVRIRNTAKGGEGKRHPPPQKKKSWIRQGAALPNDGLGLEVDAGEAEDLVDQPVVPAHLLLLLRHLLPEKICQYQRN